MIWAIGMVVAVSLGVIIGAVIGWTDSPTHTIGTKAFLACFSGVIGALYAGGAAAIVLLVPALIIVENVDQHERVDFSFDIVAAADSTKTEGTFFLFGGSVNEKPMYFYYRDMGDYVRQGHVPTNQSRVYEDTDREGYVDVVQSGCTDWSLWVMAQCDSAKRYDIHVPEGSVARQFNFDLEK